MDRDHSSSLQERVRIAADQGRPLRIVGGNTKAFYGHTVDAEPLAVDGHRGIISYEPTELVITARAGTPLSELNTVLQEQGQCLAFEPPAFGDQATLGGTVAGNFSGPSRPYSGAARDFVLGCRIINGGGEILSFGGQVMKNVAGYDVSRLMAGSLGTLGVLLEVSLKVLPVPQAQLTRVFEGGTEQSLKRVHELAGQSLLLSASCFDGERLWLRLSGADSAVRAAAGQLGGEDGDNGIWHRLREQQLAFFRNDRPLWRLSLASDLPPLSALPGNWLYEWGGAQRWLSGAPDPEQVYHMAREFSGHATLFRDHGTTHAQRFQPLPPAMLSVHKRLKQAFDPERVLNPGIMYPDL